MIHLPKIYSLPAKSVVIDNDHLALPPALADILPAQLQVEIPGRPRVSALRDGELLSARRLGERLLELGSLVQVEIQRDPLTFRSAIALGDGLATAPGELALADPSELMLRVSEGALCPSEHFFLLRETAELSIKPGFDQLLSLRAVRDVVPYRHQLNTVTTVLRQMKGRALLCDEVGLGKTIEAGLVLMEYLLRGLVKRVLILTPPSVMYQWQEEMAQKFNLDFTLSESSQFKEAGAAAWSRFDRIIASMYQAKRGEQFGRVQRTPFDMVIVDEAHYLRNRNTQAWKLVNGLDKKYILLLTATPVQNDLEELFSLITLLKPGQLKTSGEFRKRFVARGDPLKPQNVQELQRLVGQVMVRNRRSNVGIAFTQRHAYTVKVEPTPQEAELRQLVTELVRDLYPSLTQTPQPKAAPLHQVEPPGEGSVDGAALPPAREVTLNRLILKTLQMELGSSPAALTSTVERLISRPLPARECDRLNTILQVARSANGSSKLAALFQTLERLKNGEKALIFTRYLSTLHWLQRQLQDWQIEVYHGGMSAQRKDEAVERFRGDAQILLSTDAGGEGRNLQFCNLLINFDLPWNPMRIEQRIGRLSRIGQQRDVYIFNLSSAGSIEDRILEVLDRKINLFELVVGELDLILGRLAEEKDLEDLIMEMVGASRSDEELWQGIDALGERLRGLKEDYQRVKSLDDALFQEVGDAQQSR